MARWKWKIDQQEYEARKLGERAPLLADALKAGSLTRNAALIEAGMRSRRVTVFSDPPEKTAADLIRLLGRESAIATARWILQREEAADDPRLDTASD